MELTPRHHCLVYEGAPSRHLPVLAATAVEKVRQNYRVLYLNSPTMVTGMRSYLAAEGLDVIEEARRGSMILTSDQSHLQDGQFDAAVMLRGLEDTLQQALNDGYEGLWASGDMAWEFGPARDFSQLLEYEWQLEEIFQRHPQLTGVCQYHADTLPREAMRHGLMAHPAVFINQTLSLINPHYLHPDYITSHKLANPEVDSVVGRLLDLEFAI